MSELVPVDVRWPGAWEQIKHWFEDALTRSGADKNWGLDDLYQQAIEGRLRIWGAVHEGRLFGAMASQDLVFPNRRVLELPFLGGDAHTEDLWVPLFEDLKVRAKAEGFAAIIGGGRPGWARKLGGRTIYRCEFDLEDA